MAAKGKPGSAKPHLPRTARNSPGSTTATASKASATANSPAAEAGTTAAKERLPLRVANPAHRKSLDKAAKAFKHFSLSKFAEDETPKNYVDAQKVNDPMAVLAVQKAHIRQQLEKLPDTGTPNSGMTIAFPVAKLKEVKNVLPGIDKDGGKIKLNNLLSYLGGRMNGTTFYSKGNPVMRRLATEMQARSQARSIIERIKRRAGAAQSGATQPAATRKSSRNTPVPEKKGRSKS